MVVETEVLPNLPRMYVLQHNTRLILALERV